jgi:hypothetical protein
MIVMSFYIYSLKLNLSLFEPNLKLDFKSTLKKIAVANFST